jgi:hypothetical protein
MSEPDDTDRSAGAHEETFLRRWSRRKTEAGSATGDTAATTAPATPGPGDAATPASVSAPAVEAHPATGDGATPAATASTAPVDLPDLDLLDQDSDYSAFMAPGVDADLRRRALQKLFHSPKFNVFDGLDTYRDDFTSFPALGSIVTVDMRYQLDRAAKRALAELDEAQGKPAGPPPTEATAVVDVPSTETVTPAPETDDRADSPA